VKAVRIALVRGWRSIGEGLAAALDAKRQDIVSLLSPMTSSTFLRVSSALFLGDTGPLMRELRSPYHRLNLRSVFYYAHLGGRLDTRGLLREHLCTRSPEYLITHIIGTYELSDVSVERINEDPDEVLQNALPYSMEGVIDTAMQCIIKNNDMPHTAAAQDSPRSSLSYAFMLLAIYERFDLILHYWRSDFASLIGGGLNAMTAKSPNLKTVEWGRDNLPADSQTKFLIACATGDLDTAKDHNPTKRPCASERISLSDALNVAVIHSRIEVIKWLVPLLGELNDEEMDSAFIRIPRDGDEVVKTLIECLHLDVNECLFNAAFRKDYELVRLLLRCRGAMLTPLVRQFLREHAMRRKMAVARRP